MRFCPIADVRYLPDVIRYGGARPMAFLQPAPRIAPQPEKVLPHDALAVLVDLILVLERRLARP